MKQTITAHDPNTGEVFDVEYWNHTQEEAGIDFVKRHPNCQIINDVIDTKRAPFRATWIRPSKVQTVKVKVPAAKKSFGHYVGVALGYIAAGVIYIASLAFLVAFFAVCWRVVKVVWEGIV